MIVTKEQYLKEVEIIPRPDKWQINAAALDLRVGTKIYIPDEEREHELKPGQALCIERGQHFLIQTLEKVTLPATLVGVVFPRSGTNRKGLTVDMTGIVDPGYSGKLMVPVTNLTGKTIQFFVGERIAQIVFHRTEQVPEEIRQSKYHEGEIAAKPDKEEELELLRTGELVYKKLHEGPDYKRI